MTRRSAASTFVLVAVIVMVALVVVVHVPYAILSPGPVCNTVGAPNSSCPAVGDAASLISVPAGYDHASTSRLGFTTVDEQNGEPDIAEAVFSWLRASDAIVPREVLHPPGQTSQQSQQQDTQDMTQAQDAAVVVAEQALHLTSVTIASVTAGSPAAGTLQVGDVITSLDGQPVATAAALITAIAPMPAAAVLTLGITRDGHALSVALVRQVSTASGTKGKLLLGIGLTDAPKVPVTITLNPNVIGGPSAGLMFSLGVYDRLSTGDLGGTTVIAGTGTIDDTGAVGAIGGIQQKMYAARHSFHATLFLAPKSNCSDVKGAIPKGLRVVPVTSFSGALAVLAQVRAGNLASLPSC